MTEPNHPRVPTATRRFRPIFGLLASLYFLNALISLIHRQELYAAQQFVATFMWIFLAVGQPEGRPRPRWLFWSLIALFAILVTINAGIVDSLSRRF